MKNENEGLFLEHIFYYFLGVFIAYLICYILNRTWAKNDEERKFSRNISLLSWAFVFAFVVLGTALFIVEGKWFKKHI